MIVDKKTFADFIGVSPRMVSNYIEEGMPVLGGGGRGVAVQIDTAASLKWYVDRAVAKQVGSEDGEGEGEGSKAWEERRLARAKADRMELALAIDRGQRPHIDEVKNVMFALASAFGSGLDSLGNRLAGDLAATSDPAVVRQMLFDECRRIRRATADRIRAWVIEYRGGTAMSSNDGSEADAEGE